MLVPLAADSFPAPAPAATVVAVSLGHLGRRTDWALLRALAERMPELVLLLIGEWHEDESGDDAGLPGLPRGAEPRLARPPHRRGGRAADPAAPTSGSSRSSAPRSTTPRCPTGSSSTPGWGGARSRPTSGRAHVGARGAVRRRPGGVDRGAALAGRRARAAGRRAARVGAGADRARAEPAAVGAHGGAGDRERAARAPSASAAPRTRSEGRAARRGAKPGLGTLVVGDVPSAKPKRRRAFWPSAKTSTPRGAAQRRARADRRVRRGASARRAPAGSSGT